MALTATVRRFEIELSDSDRGVYETLELRVAQHPSETLRFMMARVIARCLEHVEGLEFSRGLCADDEPAIWQRSLQGDLLNWIEIGQPAIDRLHRASKASARVAVYGWKGGAELLREARAKPIHRADALEVHVFDAAFLDTLAALVDRQNKWSVARSGGALYVTVGNALHEGAVVHLDAPPA
jgi:uncharacterized protein YaeQ